MWTLLFLFFSLVSSLPPHTCTDQNVADCLRLYMDTNHDGGISAAEWNNFTLYHECSHIIQRVPGSVMISSCDADGDGFLNISDISHRRTCVAWAMQEDICLYCNECALWLSSQQ